MWQIVESWWLPAAVVLPGGALYWAARPLALRAWALAAKPVREHFLGVRRMMAAVDRMEGEIQQIKRRVDAELGPNGGGSMKDQVAGMKDQVAVIASRQIAVFEAGERPAFQADASGRFKSVNRAFEKLSGYPARDVLGKGWINLIHQDDVEAFMAAWEHAIRDGRILRRECVMVTAAGDSITICIDAIPVKSGDRVLEWQGSFAPEMEAA